MRVIAGLYKGRILHAPKGVMLRPTLDNVKEALFNIIGEGIQGARVLELFAGSGALGIEALSRGAARVTFVDNNIRCIKAIDENLNTLRINKLNQAKLVRMDAMRAVGFLSTKDEKFDIVILDPPYCKDTAPHKGQRPFVGGAKKCLQALADCDILTPCVLVIIEHYKKDLLPNSAGELSCLRSETYGDTVLSFYNLHSSVQK
ncbi:MAG: 16S rRNA (guanine(966)-N(2))-methyltransferase RsmD [Candidatus Omnitrophota bacterium]